MGSSRRYRNGNGALDGVQAAQARVINGPYKASDGPQGLASRIAEMGWDSLQTTWTHLIARAIVTPLVGTGVRPNHITTLRLLTGLGACLAVALGTAGGNLWGGALWLLSTFLDRADGELARVGNMKSEKGHAYDYFADVVVNSLVFSAVGIGARHGWLGDWAVAMGVLSTVSTAVCWVVGEWLQNLQGQKAWAPIWGFDVDDGFYLIAPLIWFGVMSVVLVVAAAVVPIAAIITVVRYARRRSQST
jgi:phosphatidylglycerophosphate synthase